MQSASENVAGLIAEKEEQLTAIDQQIAGLQARHNLIANVELPKLKDAKALLDEVASTDGAEAPARGSAASARRAAAPPRRKREPAPRRRPASPPPANGRPPASKSRAAAEELRERVAQLIATAGEEGITQAQVADELDVAPGRVRRAVEGLGSRVVQRGARPGPNGGRPSPILFPAASSRRPDRDVAEREQQIARADAGDSEPKRTKANELAPADQVLAAIHNRGEAQTVDDISGLTGIPHASVAQYLQHLRRAEPPQVAKTFNKWALTAAGVERLSELGATATALEEMFA